MKSGLKQGVDAGFTIVEVLAVLAVSGAILLSAILLVNGRQSQTQFTTAINNEKTQIQQTINDVINGYYPNNSNFSCSNGVVSSGSNNQGTNSGCIFLGKVLQFAPSPSVSPQNFEIYTIYGQQTSSGQEVSSYQLANAQVLTQSNLSGSLENGLTVTAMSYCDNGGTCSHNIGALAFLSSLASYSGGSLVSGAQQLNLIPVPDVQLNQTIATATTNINSDLAGTATNNNNWADKFTGSSAPNSVQICFTSGTTVKSGLITISSGAGQLTTALSIRGNTTCS